MQSWLLINLMELQLRLLFINNLLQKANYREVAHAAFCLQSKVLKQPLQMLFSFKEGMGVKASTHWAGIYLTIITKCILSICLSISSVMLS